MGLFPLFGRRTKALKALASIDGSSKPADSMGKPALLLLDYQTIVPRTIEEVETSEAFEPVTTAAAAARAAGIPVIWVTTNFRDACPEISPRFRPFTALWHLKAFPSDHLRRNVISDLARRNGDILVQKSRLSAFMGSDLDAVLRGLGADNVIVAGCMAAESVLSTVCQAFDLDFGVTVLENLCRAGDPEVHKMIMEKVVALRAKVVSDVHWIRSIGQESVRESEWERLQDAIQEARGEACDEDCDECRPGHQQ
jgi:nicotinamidase-related amidase